VESITELERVAAAHWRGTEEEWLGGWLLRAAEGFTGRANSALPLGDPGLPLDAALAGLTRWYRARGLPPMVAVPIPLDGDSPARALDAQPARALDAELARRSWAVRAAPAFVMVADQPAAPGPGGVPLPGARPGPGGLAAVELRADPVPDEAWLAAYHYRGQQERPPVVRTLLTSAADQVFFSVRAAGSVQAIARVSLAAGWAGITAVEVSPGQRRSGLGGALTRAALDLAASRGARGVFLQVEVDNAAARALYERAGFHYSHRYHYRVGPA
jgi:N-acetylglutamate synthase